MTPIAEPARGRIHEAFVDWRQQRGALNVEVFLDATITGPDDGLRSVISEMRSRIADPDGEDENVIGGFIYPRFTTSSNVEAFIDLIEEIHTSCVTHDVELIDVDVSSPDNDGESFLCLGGLLSNA